MYLNNINEETDLITAHEHAIPRLAFEHLIDAMVCSDVRLQVGLANHSIVTEITFERLVSRVSFHVALEVSVGLEGGGAAWMCAHKWRIS